MANEIQNRWAFLVGVNHYRESQRFRRLNHCVNDVLALQQLLKTVGYGVICLHDNLSNHDPRFPDRADTVIAEFRGLCEKIGPDDLLLVYFACHGTRNLQGRDTKPYLIFRDTRSKLPETALSISDFKAEMVSCQAERQVMLLDACHMGAGTDDRSGDTEAERQFIRNVHELATGFALLTASTAQQTAKESSDIQHGVFSHFVLSGLRGEGEALVSKTDLEKKFVSVNSLRNHVYNNLLIWSAEKGYDQTPQGQAEGDLGDFILVDYRDQPFPVLTEALSPLIEAAGEQQEQFARSGADQASGTYESAVQLTFGQQRKLEDRRRKLAKLEERIEKINKKIEEGVDFEDEEKYETRKENIFKEIDLISKDIQGLERGHG